MIYDLLDSLNEYWDAMPGMREDIFRSITPEYVELCAMDVELLIKEHPATHKYKAAYADSFEGFRDILSERLLKNYDSVNSQDEEERISEEIFRRMNNIKVIDKKVSGYRQVYSSVLYGKRYDLEDTQVLLLAEGSKSCRT